MFFLYALVWDSFKLKMKTIVLETSCKLCLHCDMDKIPYKGIFNNYFSIECILFLYDPIE